MKFRISIKGDFKASKVEKRRFCRFGIFKSSGNSVLCSTFQNKTQSENVNKIFARMAVIPCETCGQNFGSNFALQRHIQAVHLGQRNFTCVTCGEGFVRQDQFRNHVRRNHENVQIQCQICSQTFATVENRNRHLRTVHGGQRNYKCVSCDMSFGQMSDLKRYIIEKSK